MSVVNKMLKDLENRQSDVVTTANYQPPVKAKGNKLRIAVWSLVAVVLLATAYIFVGDNHRGSAASSDSILPINQQVRAPISPTLLSSSEGEDGQEDNKQNESKIVKNEHNSLAQEPSLSLNNQKSSQQHNQATPSNKEFRRTVSSEQKEQFFAEGKPQDATVLESAENIATTTSDKTENTSSSSALSKASDPPVEPVVMQITRSSVAAPPMSIRAGAQQAMAQGDVQKAMGLWRQLLRQEPENVEASKTLAALYFSEGQWRLAQDTLERGRVLSPADDSLILMLARLYAQRGQSEKAMQTLSSTPYPNTELLAFRATLAQQLDNYVVALEDYKRLTVLEPETAKWWLGLGVVADKREDSALAMEAYSQAIALEQLDSDISTFMRQRIEILSKAKNKEVTF